MFLKLCPPIFTAYALHNKNLHLAYTSWASQNRTKQFYEAQNSPLLTALTLETFCFSRYKKTF